MELDNEGFFELVDTLMKDEDWRAEASRLVREMVSVEELFARIKQVAIECSRSDTSIGDQFHAWELLWNAFGPRGNFDASMPRPEGATSPEVAEFLITQMRDRIEHSRLCQHSRLLREKIESFMAEVLREVAPDTSRLQ